MRYVVVDPSGSFNEGKGHTGIAVMHDEMWNEIGVRDFNAKNYEKRYDYWKDIIEYVTLGKTVYEFETTVIIESFIIRTDGILMGQMPETIQLIGALVYELEKWKIPYIFQTPAQAKTRFKDELLPKYIPGLERDEANRYKLNGKRINDHQRDALKHLLFYKKYKEPKE